MDSQLVVFVSLYDHVADVLDVAELVIYSDPYPVCSVFVITGINGLVLTVKRLENLGRHNSQIGHFVFLEGYVYARVSFAVDFHACHSFYFR